jgi:hypothetical protein
MQASKTLRRPSNWPDFETLCKKLWGEIWQCEEIKKNGRAGQAQHGVDVYGVPESEVSYYGIQCKGKDEYTDKQFSEKEIRAEINKAKKFKPALKKLYFTTTAVKDAKIEQFVRERDLENRNAGLFEVHLYSWEDIVDLIDENKKTADWYLHSQNYKLNQQAALTFEDGQTTFVGKPQYKQHKTVYRMDRPMPKLNPLFSGSMEQFYKTQVMIDRLIPKAFIMQNNLHAIKTNLSFIPISLRVQNTGTEALEEYKVYISFDGQIQQVARRNANESLMALTIQQNFKPTTYVNEKSQTVTLIPRNPVLVPNDAFQPATFYIKAGHGPQQLTLQYKLLSKSYQCEGSLTIDVQPQIDVIYTRISVDIETDERTESCEIEEVVKVSEQ